VSDAPSSSPSPEPLEPAADAAELDLSHPDYRFTLANERTFLAWVRTALALLAAGVGVNLTSRFSTSAGRHTLGLALIALSLVAATASYLRWRAADESIRRGVPLSQSRGMPVIAGGLVVVALLALVLALFDL
jgi:putative membrane protein